MSNPVKTQSSSNPNLMMADHVSQSVNPNPTVDVANLTRHLKERDQIIVQLRQQLKEKDAQLAEMHSILQSFNPKQAPTIEGETYELKPSLLTDAKEALINHVGFRIGNIRSAAIECKTSYDGDITIAHMVRKTITLLMIQLFKHDNTLRYTTPSRELNTNMTRFPEEISTKIANGILKLIQTSSKTYLTTLELWKRWIHNEITHVLAYSPTRRTDSPLFKQIDYEEYLKKLNFDEQAAEDGWYANVSSALNVTNVPAFVPTATTSDLAASTSRFISGPEPATSFSFNEFGLSTSVSAPSVFSENFANTEQGTSSASNPFLGTWEQSSNQSLPAGYEMGHRIHDQMYHGDHNIHTMTWNHQQQQGPWNYQQQQGPWNHQQQGQNDGNQGMQNWGQDLLLQLGNEKKKSRAGKINVEFFRQGNGAGGGVMMASNNPLRSLPDEWVMQPTGATTYNDPRIGGPTEDYPPPRPSSKYVRSSVERKRESCPGVSSENAEKASGCAGCPNQKSCASGEKPPPDVDIPKIQDRFRHIKHKVAILDIDICGPSQLRMMGVEDEQVHQSADGWTPVSVADNLTDEHRFSAWSAQPLTALISPDGQPASSARCVVPPCCPFSQQKKPCPLQMALKTIPRL
ncbi:hypothetical protein WR25_07984, partial [Diploscapter pachys]